ncbi:DUF2971 domain-containing protein [Nocardia sp. NPDC003183]
MLKLEGRNVEWDGPVWKYLRRDRFISTLKTSTLYFAAATQFHDPFEGAVSVQVGEHDVGPPYAALEHAFFALKRLTKISCWHRASYESDAMWKLYADEHKGIAICTTPERMRAAFQPFRLSPDCDVEQLIAAPVEYIDLTEVRMNDTGMLNRFFFKHRAFEWEREFRLAISLRMAEEFGVQVPDGGIHVEFDLEAFVEKIVLGSTISADERKIVATHVESAGLGDRLQYSTLLGRPRYV